jgi:hypothetical protein
MMVRLSALRSGRPLPPGRFLVLISDRGWVNPRAIVRLGGLSLLKNPMTSSGIKPATCASTNYATAFPYLLCDKERKLEAFGNVSAQEDVWI